MSPRVRQWLPVCAIALAGAAQAGNLLVDPTRPASAPESAGAVSESGGVHVQAIVSRAGSRVAIVDGKLVHAGDRIANILIEEVTPEGVRYSQGGQSGFARLQCPKALPVRHTPTPQRDVP